MSCKKTERFSETWFFKWILNNQAVVSFLILLLIGLTVLIFTKISPIFSPVIQFLTIIMLSVNVTSVLLDPAQPNTFLLPKENHFQHLRTGPKIKKIFLNILLYTQTYYWGCIVIIFLSSSFYPYLKVDLKKFYVSLC